MENKDIKILGFDFIRAFAILFVFIAHIGSHNEAVLLLERAISPGLTMSLLGFISAYLITSKYETFNGDFYIKRFSRIYSSLIVCLSTITLLHFFLSYNVVNQHSLIHFMGLSFFMELFQIANKSSLGAGLWFVTIINLLYLLLPLMRVLYKHQYARLHLLIVIFLCLFFNKVMYGTASAWNVVMAFNIGCYIGINSNIEIFSKKSKLFYSILTFLLLILAGLATLKIIPYEIRSFLFPLYPFVAIPLLYKVGNNIKGYLKSTVIWFSSISFEVYILHFYFINQNFSKMFPQINSFFCQVIIAIIIVFTLAHLLSKISKFISNLINKYLSENEWRVSNG